MKVSFVATTTDVVKLQSFATGTTLATVNIAENVYMGKDATTGEVKTHTNFYRLEGWKFNADKLATVPKGTTLMISGELKVENYETSEGKKGVNIKVVVDTFTPIKIISNEERKNWTTQQPVTQSNPVTTVKASTPVTNTVNVAPTSPVAPSIPVAPVAPTNIVQDELLSEGDFNFD